MSDMGSTVSTESTASDVPAWPAREALPVSIVVPTLGRDSLRACVQSLAECSPPATEILLVTQANEDSVQLLAEEFGDAGARLVPCPGRGVAHGRNLGLRDARHDIVLITDDDCTVMPDWVERARALAEAWPGAIVTGRVLPVGERDAVPSFKDDPEPHDFTGAVHGGALFPNNMVCDRRAILATGGFDERFGPGEAAEDNEFCYRWLRAGRMLRYEPSLVVRHHDWRSPEQLERLYVRYARGQGFFYAKYLRRGDPTMLRWIGRDAYWALRGSVAAVVKRRSRWSDPRRGIARGLPGGLIRGWRVFGEDTLP
ncbi:MAG: glycosyltransferase family 2 protein [Gaiellaceae bacterium]